MLRIENAHASSAPALDLVLQDNSSSGDSEDTAGAVAGKLQPARHLSDHSHMVCAAVPPPMKRGAEAQVWGKHGATEPAGVGLQRRKSWKRAGSAVLLVNRLGGNTVAPAGDINNPVAEHSLENTIEESPEESEEQSAAEQDLASAPPAAAPTAESRIRANRSSRSGSPRSSSGGSTYVIRERGLNARLAGSHHVLDEV